MKFHFSKTKNYCKNFSFDFKIEINWKECILKWKFKIDKINNKIKTGNL